MKMINRALVRLCLLLLVAIFTVLPVAADSSRTEAQSREVLELKNPEAIAELKRATDFLVAQPRLQLKARIFLDVIQEDGRRLQFEKNGEIRLQRPNQLYVESRRDDGKWRKLWYEGDKLSIADLSLHRHTQINAPSTIDETLDMLETLVKEPQPLADLLYSDLSHLEEYAVEADIVGESFLNGLPCTHLSFRGETVDWQLWIEQGEKPLIRKVAVSYREAPGSPQYFALIDDWKTPDKFKDSQFKFVVPENSEYIKVLAPGLRKSKKGGQP